MARAQNRAYLTDGTGRWFDPDAAERWDEATRFDGCNNISCATRSEWAHEALYRTAGGRWVLRAWSQWQGACETYRAVTEHEAAVWLVENEHEAPASLAGHIESLEL